MEEYKDLDLTVALFTTLLDRPEFTGLPAGIVLQAYLPDALGALEELAAFARRRVAAGGAPIKVRLVKGANLAMEKVDAEVHDWPQAPYTTKAEVDANYVRLLDRAIGGDLVDALRLGVASHHLHHVALAVELAAARGAERQIDVEMLQGMAPAQAKVVARDVREQLVLYTPVVHTGDFDAAVSYLVRRLEENASPENYLYALFSDAGPASYTDRFRASVRDRDAVPATPRRSAHVSDPGRPRTTRITREREHFVNVPDTDPSLAANREWALRAIAAPGPGVREPELTDPDAVDAVVERASAAAWRDRPAAERAAILREAARALAAARGDLLTVMVDEAGKTIAEADPEISEAIDFAAYYADRAEELDGAPFTPDRVVVVTPPWNFPIAIPLGGCVAALAAGASVVIKPAPQVRACAEVGVAALHRGGIPADALQLVHTDEGDAGRRLVTHPAVDHVVLTGASQTAELFRSWRPDLRLIAETSGKNALIVTPSADPDLAVADLVRSAFGHAGQKCSAASLAILVGSMRSTRTAAGSRFHRQLADAVRTLRVGHGSDPSTTMGPLIGPPDEKLERALTRLDRGETLAGRAPQARRVALDTGGEGARGARLVVPRHRVLRAGARAHARGGPRRGDRAAERDGLRPHRRPARPRPGRDRPLERARRGRQRLRQPPHHGRDRAAPVVRGLEGLRGRAGREAGRPELRRPVRDVARRTGRRAPVRAPRAGGRGAARGRGPALGRRGPRMAARRRRVGRRRLAGRVLRRARPDGTARRGQRLPLPAAARAAARGRLRRRLRATCCGSASRRRAPGCR